MENVYEEFLNEDSEVTVVDTSFLLNPLSKYLSWIESKNIKDEYFSVVSNYYNFWEAFSFEGMEHVTFPKETVEEFKYGKTYLERKINSYFNSHSYRREVRKLRGHGEKVKRGKIIESFNLVREALSLILDKIKLNPTEEYIKFYDDGIKERILPAVLNITQRRGSKKTYDRRYGDKRISERFIENDERIYSKSYVMSFEGNTRILTSDSDFGRMHNDFSKSLRNLSEYYGFELAEWSLSVDSCYTGLNEESKPIIIEVVN
jgi:hypothetical protein